MKVLMLSFDPTVKDPASEAGKRMHAYRALTDELFIAVFDSKRGVRGLLSLYLSGRAFMVRERARTRDVLITAQDPFEVGLVGYLLKLRYGARLQLQVHTDFLSPYFRAESFKNAVRGWIARLILPRADCVRVVSARIREGIAAYVPRERVMVLPIQVPLDAYRASEPVRGGASFVFVVVSRLAREKNVALALDAFADVVKERPEAKLLIVGDGPVRARLEAQAATPLLRTHVQFLGWRNDLPDVFRMASCYILTSNYEGYGRTVVEAMAAGIPVIMTDVGIAGDLVRQEETGLVVPIGDRAAIKEAMLRMMHEAELREQVARKAREAIAALPTREEYLAAYKKSWETCGLTQHES